MNSNPSRTSLVTLGVVTAGTLLAGRALRSTPELELAPKPSPVASVATPPIAFQDPSCGEHRLTRPTGETTGLDCASVRRVIRQIHSRFPVRIAAPVPSEFAEGVANWLDPYGFWSAASDAPPRAAVFARAERLIADIEGKGDARCESAREIGASLVHFTDELGEIFDRALATAPHMSRDAAAALGIEPVFDDGQATTPPRALAGELGRRLGSIDRAYSGALSAYVAAGRERYFPPLDADGWRQVVLAAALRGYVETIDPHGQWAPLDEEWSLYAGDPSFDDPDRLWGDMLRTALGIRVVDQPTAPLEVDDLVLAVDGVATTGLSMEHAEQLSRAPGGPESTRRLIVLRQGETLPLDLAIAPPAAIDGIEAAVVDDELDVELVPYGRSYAAVIGVPYVRDDLGERLLEALDSLASDGPPEGLLLDLRGNAGGSMDGATSALSVFLPEVPLFPLFHSGRLVEVLTTHHGDSVRFQGPVAVLVDGATASAAEMIAGALDRYNRAVVLGQPTFGKGCVQEYFQDDAGTGILRLTTRLFTFPDGSPVQRRGLVPAVPLQMPSVLEHESDVPGALAAIEGPDVRVALLAAPSWPSHGGRLGPCRERIVCAALGQAARAPARALRGDFSAKARRRSDPVRR